MSREYKQPIWAEKIWEALFEVHPDGLGPKELRRRTGLSAKQVVVAADYLRGVFRSEHEPPIVYVRRQIQDAYGGTIGPNKWYIASTWASHVRTSVNSEYLLQSYSRLESADQLLQKAEVAFPRKVRRIRKIRRNAEYLREELGDLISDMREDNE